MVFVGPKGRIFRWHDGCREEQRECEERAKGTKKKMDGRKEVKLGGRELLGSVLGSVGRSKWE